MRKIISLLIIILSIQAVFASAAKGFDVSYERVSSQEIKLNFTSNFTISVVEKDGVKYSKINNAGNILTKVKGYAELPYHTSTVQLTNNKNVTVKYFSDDYEDIVLDHPLLPSRGTIYRNQDPSAIPYEIATGSIKDEWYPGKVSEITDPFIMRDVRGTNVIIYPYQYNAKTQTLRVYKTLEISLIENETEVKNPLTKPSNVIVPEMDAIYRSLFINYNEESKFAYQVGEIGELLVIYTSRDASVIQPYITWKKENGFKVQEIEVPVGTNVLSTIQDAYDANRNILYVQLVGDWTEIKCDIGTEQSQPMDPMLGCVVGRDIYPELIIGRFSASTTDDVTVQINKAINYEKNPDIDGAWYSKGLGIGSPDGSGIGDDGEIDYNHIDVIKDNKLLPNTYDTVNEAYGTPSTATVADFVNAGLSVINYCGHGDKTYWVTSGYSNTNIGSSTNGNMLPFIFSVACVNGQFNTGECFGEAWLKKSNGGAVAALMATINQPWVPPMRGQDYINDILTGGYNYTANPGNGTSTTSADHRTTYGSIALNGNVLMLIEAPTDVSTQETIKTWTIFGDASFQVRTDQPLEIENSNSILLAENYSTSVASGGNPVENAKVTLYQNGENFTALTNSTGQVSIDHTFTEGDVTVTVTGFNLETLQEDFPVIILDGPYMKINSYSISTDLYGGSAIGNFELKNIGIENSSDIVLNISTDSPYIAFVDATENFGNISIDDSTLIADCIAFDIDSNTPDQERIEFATEITDSYAKRTYNSKFYLTVNSPEINISHSIESNVINPGESKDVNFRIENNGSADLSNIVVELNQVSSFQVSITDPIDIELLNYGNYTDAVFNCSFDGSIPISSSVEFVLSIINGNGFQSDYAFTVTAGLTDDFETGDFTSNEWIMYGYDWVIDTTEVYSGSYSSKSGAILDDQYSKMLIEYDFGDNASVSFYRKVSSEASYDHLYFYIDGHEQEKWSGNLGWAKVSYDIGTGTHDLFWSYVKDNILSSGSDCAWVDNILVSGITTGIENMSTNMPNKTTLYNNYPNPFNPSTEIRFFIAKQSNVKLSIFNSSGQKVKDLVNDRLNKGMHLMKFSAGDLNSGVYYYVLETEGNKFSEKMLLIK